MTLTGFFRNLALTFAVFLAVPMFGQAPSTPKKEFDVASVKLNTFGTTQQNPPITNVDLDPGDIFVPTGGVFSVRNKSLRTLIAFAYKMSGDQQNFLKLNVPDFVLTERFDVEARTTEKASTKDDYRAMVRSMLEDRFKLKVHNENRESKIYSLVQIAPGKLGPSMRMHPADDTTCDNDYANSKRQPFTPDGFPRICGTVVTTQWQNKATDTKFVMGIAGRNIPMEKLAAALLVAGDTGLDHAIIDKTGITGNVDFTLNLGYDEMESTNTPNTAPYFLQELKDQLGMKLRADKGTVNIYVVDHVEHLSDN